MPEILLILLTILLGILAGTFTGLIPGLHVNLIAIFLSSSFLFFQNYFSPLVIVSFIIAMSITHTFLDFIPSIFLGSPDEDTGLSILPGHKLLNLGKGYQALIYTLYGSSLAILVILIFIPFMFLILPKIYPYIQSIMFLILILASLYLLAKETNSKLAAISVFFLSGFLGLASFSLTNQPHLPLLTGLFGSSSLITSMLKKTKLPKQKITPLKKIKIRKKTLKNIFLASIFSAPLCSFLPSLGSSQAAVIGSDLINDKDEKQFLMLLGSINTIVVGLSFITIYTISRARTGTSLAVKDILRNFSLNYLIIFIITILVSAFISFFLAIFLGKLISKHIDKLNYAYLSLGILILLSISVLIFSNFLGFLIFIVASSTGLVAIYLKIRRTHLMGALMIPTILFYLPF